MWNRLRKIKKEIESVKLSAVPKILKGKTFYYYEYNIIKKKKRFTLKVI